MHAHNTDAMVCPSFVIAVIISAIYTVLYFKKMKVKSKSENEIRLMF